MEDKENQNYNNLVKILLKQVKTQSSKIMELSERVKKCEISLDEEKDQTDKRFDKVIERFDSSDETIVDNVDSIADLENKYSKITSQMGEISLAMGKVDKEIKDIETGKLNMKMMPLITK